MRTKIFAQQLTNTYHLGVPEASYHWSRAVPGDRASGCQRSCFVLSLLSLAVTLLMIHYNSHFTTWGIMAVGVIPFLIFLVLGLLIFVLQLDSIRGDPAYVFSEGFVLMDRNAPGLIIRWSEIEKCWIELRSSGGEYTGDGGITASHVAYAYHFTTTSGQNIEVPKKMYVDYFQRYKYNFLKRASLQLLTDFEAGRPISFGNLIFEKQGIHIQHNFYYYRQIHSFFLNPAKHTLTMNAFIPRPSKPTVVQQPPPSIIVPIQGSIDLCEDLLYYIVRHTSIRYNRDDPALSSLNKHYETPGSFCGIWPPKEKKDYNL